MLGDKPDLPVGASDDIKADASNRKRAKLYKVRELGTAQTNRFFSFSLLLTSVFNIIVKINKGFKGSTSHPSLIQPAGVQCQWRDDHHPGGSREPVLPERP